MASVARRRAIVRAIRLRHSWPLWYAGAAAVGLAVAAASLVAGRPDGLPYGLALTVPFLGFLAWLVFILALAGLLNLGRFLRTHARRLGSKEGDDDPTSDRAARPGRRPAVPGPRGADELPR